MASHILIMVHSLLSNLGQSQNKSVVGRFVLYAGKERAFGDKRWLEGIVINTTVSNATTDDRREAMCKVLYANGWVIWHKKSAFGTQRDSNLLWFDDFKSMVKFQGSDSLANQLESTGMYEKFINSRPSAASTKQANMNLLEEELKKMYAKTLE